MSVGSISSSTNVAYRATQAQNVQASQAANNQAAAKTDADGDNDGGSAVPETSKSLNKLA